MYVKEKEIFIIGKGSSAASIDLTKLHDKYTLCLNHAVFKVPNPKGLVFVDRAFWTECKDFIMKFDGEIYAGAGAGYHPFVKMERGLTRLSGLFALRIALLLAEKVYLIGYDLNKTEEDEWPYFDNNFSDTFNKNYHDKKGVRCLYSEQWWIDRHIFAFQDYFKNDIDRIFNCNENSGIKIFPFVKYEDIV